MKLAIHQKSQIRIWIMMVVISSYFSNESMASSLSSANKCSVHFMGTVVSVLEVGAPLNIKSQKLEVTFRVDEDDESEDDDNRSLKVGDRYYLKVIKGGAYEFKSGHSYEVYADSGYLCHSRSES